MEREITSELVDDLINFIIHWQISDLNKNDENYIRQNILNIDGAFRENCCAQVIDKIKISGSVDGLEICMKLNYYTKSLIGVGVPNPFSVAYNSYSFSVAYNPYKNDWENHLILTSDYYDNFCGNL